MGLDRETEVGLTIHEIGNSEGPVIPKHWREDLGISKGDSADAVFDKEAETVTFHF